MAADQSLVRDWEAGKATPIAEGSSRALWLHKPVFEVCFTVKNTGSVFGGDIPQLYLNYPPTSGEPPSVLRGFTNIELSPGEQKKITLTLSRYDLSIWDAEKQGWRKPEGKFGVGVGVSSRDVRLKGVVPV